MNKYIKTDIENGYTYLKIGVTNALSDIDNGEEKKIEFGHSIPLSLIKECLREMSWAITDVDFDWLEAVSPTSKLHVFITEDNIMLYENNNN